MAAQLHPLKMLTRFPVANSRRMALYRAMLEQMTDEQRLQTTGKLVQVCCRSMTLDAAQPYACREARVLPSPAHATLVLL